MMNFLAVMWDVDPIMISIGPLELRYYGLAWAITFGLGMYYFTDFIKREGYPEKVFDSICWYATLGTIIGARLGHCLFYDLGYYLTNPLEILCVWHGGLASHGAAIGLLVGLWLFSKKNKMKYIWSLDRIMVPVTIGGGAVRLGNLMNSEIYGVESDLPWAFVFQKVGETAPKHPTQIYEALCYFALFAILMWFYYRKDYGVKRPGLMFGVSLTGVFLSRFFIEYIKEPQEAFEESLALLMGQWLSIPFVILGVVMIVYAIKNGEVSKSKVK